MHTRDVREQGYINYAVCCDYSSPSRTGSTSTSPCAVSTRLRYNDIVYDYFDYSSRLEN
jgi:hypothetical protein